MGGTRIAAMASRGTSVSLALLLCQGLALVSAGKRELWIPVSLSEGQDGDLTIDLNPTPVLRTQATAMPHMYQSESVYAPYGPYAPYPVVIQPSPYRTPPPHLGSFLAQFPPPPDALLQQLVQQMGQIIGLNNRATTLVITCLMNSAQIAGAQAATATVAN